MTWRERENLNNDPITEGTVHLFCVDCNEHLRSGKPLCNGVLYRCYGCHDMPPIPTQCLDLPPLVVWQKLLRPS